MEITRGTALIEGVALASRHWRVAAVREADGTIFVGTARARHPTVTSIPFLRGLFMWFLESPSDLLWAATAPHTEELPPNRLRNPISVLMSAATAHGFPLLAFYFVGRLAPSSWALQLAILALQLTVFVVYMLLIRRVQGMDRVLQYAGAFKKAYWQARAPATTLRDHPKWHWHSFTIGMALVLATIAVAAGFLLPHLPPRFLYTWLVRIALMPVVVPIVDELQRLLAKLGHGLALRVLFAPLVAIDLVATKEPDAEMLEVANACSMKLRALEG